MSRRTELLSVQKSLESMSFVHLRGYEETRRSVSWAAAQAHLAGLPGVGLNIPHEAVDRHVVLGHGIGVAMGSGADVARDTA